ncbi:MAG: hypothetical protein K0R98_1174 [Rickettsiaceae bacterium]|nr:hypothetical protein [Rickettsiaceae bacterium]
MTRSGSNGKPKKKHLFIGEPALTVYDSDKHYHPYGILIRGQAMPVITDRPADKSTILKIITTFLSVYIAGVYKTYEEVRKQHEGMLYKINNNMEKLERLYQESKEWEQSLSSNSSLTSSYNSELQHRISNIAYHLAEIETLQQKKRITNTGKNCDWTGILDISCVLGGNVLNVGETTYQIGSLISPDAKRIIGSALGTAISNVGKIASGVFLLGNAAALVYASSEIHQGFINKSLLKKNRAHLRKTFELYPGCFTEKQNIEEIIDTQIHFVKKRNIEYGIVNLIGHALSTAATISGLTVAGVVASLPLTLISLPFNIGSSVSRIIYQYKEQKYKGVATEYAEDYLTNYDILALFKKYKNKPDIYSSTLKELNKGLGESTDKLAVMKSLTILYRLINNKKYKKLSADEKISKIETLLKGKTDWFSPKFSSKDDIEQGKKWVTFRKPTVKGSSLEQTIGSKVKKIYWENKSELKKFLELPNKEANKRIISCAVRCLNNEKCSLTELKKKPFYMTRDRLNDILESLDMQDSKVYKKINHGSELNAQDYKNLAINIAKRGKSSFKAIRFYLADNIVRTSHIVEICEKLSPSYDTPPIKRTLNPNQLLQKDEAEDIAKSIYEKKHAPKSYTQFNEISRNIDKDGNRLIIYSDPFDSNPSANITYFISKNNQLTIRYGNKTSAIIPLQKHTDNNITGIEIHRVHNGRYEGHAIAEQGEGKSNLSDISPNIENWVDMVKRTQNLNNRSFS